MPPPSIDELWEVWHGWTNQGFNDILGLLTAIRIWCGSVEYYVDVLQAFVKKTEEVELHRRQHMDSYWSKAVDNVRAHLAEVRTEQGRLDTFTWLADKYELAPECRHEVFQAVQSDLPPLPIPYDRCAEVVGAVHSFKCM